MTQLTGALRAALDHLGVDQLALSIHDPSFPSDDLEETGRGTPYGRGAAAFLTAIAGLGFDTIQLGPQGLTHPHNPSPYDGAIFARNVASVALAPMVDAGWITEAQRAELIGELPADRRRADHRRSRQIVDAALELATAAAAEHAGELAEFREANRDWLERDALYEILTAAHGTGDTREWPELDQRLWADDAPARVARRRELLDASAGEVDRFALWQAIAHRQHAELRARCAAVGLSLAGDLQIGMAPRDAWSYQAVLWPDYLMGAPPSRTNPDGQAWNYPILDPTSGDRGAARGFVRARLAKLFREYDAVRIDHPHGWVCPWVYRADHPDPDVAVREGARLWSSPDIDGHPKLAPLSLVGPDQLDRSVPRHDDNWVRSLTAAQIDAYGQLFDELIATAGGSSNLICEVLSTQPRPLAEVLARHGLGRFRVTQKAALDNPDDVYRADNARPGDWIMVGNHDTASIWELIETWSPAELEAQARHLAARLSPRSGPNIAEWLAGDRNRVALAKLAELFCSEARNVQIFFADLFGIRERYNKPGTVGDHNWTVRVPADWSERYPRDAAAGEALSVPLALSLALRARGGAEAEALADRLEASRPH